MKKIPFILVLLAVTASLLIPAMAFAADTGENRPIAAVSLPTELKPDYAVDIKVDPANPTEAGNLILQAIAGSLIYLAGPAAVLMIAVGGFRYVIAHGEQSQLEEAKKNIMWAVIGLIVIIISYAIVSNVIGITTKVPEVGTQTQTQPAGETAGDQGEEGGAQGGEPQEDASSDVGQ